MYIQILSSSTNLNINALPFRLYPHFIEDIIVLIVQPQKILQQDNFLMYVVFLWPVITLPCAVCLYLIRKRNGFITTYLDAFGVIVGGGSFQISHRIEKYFAVFLSISSLMLNTLFTGNLFERYTSVQEEHRIKSLNELSELRLPLYIYGIMMGTPDATHLDYMIRYFFKGIFLLFSITYMYIEFHIECAFGIKLM